MGMFYDFSDLFSNLFSPRSYADITGTFADTTHTYHAPEPAYKITTITYGTKPFYYHSCNGKRWK